MKLRQQIHSGQASARPRYFISDRPEAYEIWGEVSREQAGMLARLIADHAARHFPDIEFRIDGDWHSHDHNTELVAAYIESNWQAWAAAMANQKQTAR